LLKITLFGSDFRQRFLPLFDTFSSFTTHQIDTLKATAVDGSSATTAAPGMSYPSPASTDELVSKVLVDFKTHDYRGFIFVVHATYGLMLLRCTRKKNKPLHWQLPGGHVDEPEFNKAAEENSDRKTQLSAAGKMGAARELFEETGIDVRKELDRLQPANLRTKTKAKKGVELLQNEYKYRLFYFLSVTDTDFPSKGETPFGTDGKHLKVRNDLDIALPSRRLPPRHYSHSFSRCEL
jgi:8-oxo-dGTP pyrophosphatase MutT (NUDIX family)